ncbi:MULTISPECIES: hypothetical protein [Paenibacillus]
MEQATTFLQDAFGADICYDALNKPEEHSCPLHMR